MKIGVAYSLRNPPHPQWFKPWPDYYSQALDHMAEMEWIGRRAWGSMPVGRGAVVQPPL
jgi:hypothetical protein